jgi:hypothetical protein
MPVLRTKVKTGWGKIPTTTLWAFGSGKYVLENLGLFDFPTGKNSTRLEYLESYRPLSPQARVQLKKLNSFSKLPINWDGEGAVPPSEGILREATGFLKSMDEYDMPIDFSAPGPNGEILLEYRSNGFSAEIYFNPGEENEMILYSGQEQVYCDIINLDELVAHFSTLEPI